jgi:homoserine kinase type II
MQRELERVLSHYPLGTLTDVHQVKQGFATENCSVTTTQGHFFIKRRPLRQGQARLLLAQHALMEHLRRHGFPAPTLIKTLAGETLLPLDDHWYEIQEYIDGEPFDHHRPTHLEEAALTLGTYHSCVRGFAPAALCSLGELYTARTVHEMLRRLGQAWKVDADPALAALIEELQACAQELATGFAQHGRLSRLVIHGDYYADNLIFRGDRIVGVVDYDKARREPRVVELAEALIYFASSRPGQMRHIVYPGFLDWSPLSRFLRGYNDAHALQREDVRALPDYICTIWLYWSTRRLVEGEPHPDHALEALQEVVSLVDWARDQADVMREIALSVIAN